MAHGAGAGMTHPFMEAFSLAASELGIATLRYQFPFIEQGKKRPDPPPLSHATVRAAAAEALRIAPDLPLFAGGKSFGGRMTSQAQAASPIPELRGLVFLGFPLHPAHRPSDDRAKHLLEIVIPMLFLQGTRDALCDLHTLAPTLNALDKRASLALISGADHSFHVPARSGRTDADVRRELALRINAWMLL